VTGRRGVFVEKNDDVDVFQDNLALSPTGNDFTEDAGVISQAD
jgi:hypothetical protein